MRNPDDILESEKRKNSFLALRILLSLSVVVSHVSGSAYRWRELSIGEFSIGTLAVFGFFAISGYLVTPGILRFGIRRYSINRVVRIYPAYLFSVVITVLVFFPIWIWQANIMTTSLKTPAFFILKNIVLIPQSATSVNSTWNSLDGMPIQGSNPGLVNGSVWTLPLEITCYAALALLVVIAKNFSNQNFRVFVTVIVSMLWITSIVLALGIPDISEKHNSHLTQLLTKWPYFLAFAVGVLTRLVYKVKFAKGVLFSLGLFSLICTSNLLLWAVCGSVLFSYLWIQVGESQTFDRISNVRDISYGIYLYHFPVLQVLVGYDLLYKRFSFLLLTTVVISALLAYVSSRFIEIPAQLLVKKRLGKPKSA